MPRRWALEDRAAKCVGAPSHAATNWGLARRAASLALVLLVRAQATDGDATPRRATAVGTKFSLVDPQDPGGTDYGWLSSPTQTENTENVNAHAGVTYQKFIITATSGLGPIPASDTSVIRVKLVPYDLASTLQSCEEAAPQMTAPLDGTSGHASANAESRRNEFSNVRFPLGGRWRLCYAPDGVTWEELYPGITVFGVETSSNTIWCSYELLRRQECQNDATLLGCECMGKVEGFKRNNVTQEYIQLGSANPPYPPWLLTLIEDRFECGGSSNVGPFSNQITAPSYHEGYEVHNFGAAQAGTTLGSWKVCYCVGYDADSGSGSPRGYDSGLYSGVWPCYGAAPQDFAQHVGRLVTVDTRTKDPIYATLRFNLELRCGVESATDSSTGGCSSTSSPRYKIIRKASENNYLYFQAEAGCRFTSQAETEVLETTIVGGHLAPINCEENSATKCNDEPEVLGPKIPTWNDVQVDASYVNGVMLQADFDVCYCDNNCLNSMYWFKAGEIVVRVISMEFFADAAYSTIQRTNVATNYILVVGSRFNNPGSWSTTGSNTREMKILRDDAGHADKKACLNDDQPPTVSGHRLVSGNTDYTDPSKTLTMSDGRPTGQLYGRVCSGSDESDCSPNIKITEAGWYSVCYCDSNCNQQLNWLVVGRSLFSGPKPNQRWTQYVGVKFTMDVEGWGLQDEDQIRILSYEMELSDCGLQGRATGAFGPDEGRGAQLLQEGTNNAKITSLTWSSEGTEITFDGQHFLKEGDRISLLGVTFLDPGHLNDMYDTTHEVFVNCDDPVTQCYKILIPVKFAAADFPAQFVGRDIRWKRNSVETFLDIKISFASPEGRAYVICWSPNGQSDEAFVGQAGKLEVKNPLEMEARLGLTSTAPEQPSNPPNGAPVFITFTTGTIAHYEQATGQLHLKVVIMRGDSDEEVFQPRDFDLQQVEESDIESYNHWEEAHQSVCARFFVELWSAHEDGFPQPAGCYVDVDKSSPNTNQHYWQFHILFSPRNHLKANTMYMMVMNFNVMRAFRDDNPAEGPIYIWSLDDIVDNPFSVIELGRAIPMPNTRVPPRAIDGTLLEHRGLGSGDPMFHDEDGFKINGTDGILELYRYCAGMDPVDTANSPSPIYACRKGCKSEADCGNFDPNLNFCVGKISEYCPNYQTEYAFRFSVRAASGAPIKVDAILRIFLHPLTQWNVGDCSQLPWKTVNCGYGENSPVCPPPVCQAEALAHGEVRGPIDYPANVLRLRLQGIQEITDTVEHSYLAPSLNVPLGGFFPESITAELTEPDGKSRPHYWNKRRQIPTNGARLYHEPRMLSASIVSSEGNFKPFRGDQRNRLYLRIVSGATLFTRGDGGIKMQFAVPPGYECQSVGWSWVNMPALKVVENIFPSTQGRLVGTSSLDPQWDKGIGLIKSCDITFKRVNVLYARSVVFTEMEVDNPITPLPRGDVQPTNKWTLRVENTEFGTPLNMPPFDLETPFDRATQEPAAGYTGSVSVLGKLSSTVISPTNFGVGVRNTMLIFFRTEQAVGTPTEVQTEIWVDAPSTFDFGPYCVSSQLEDAYYIPEPGAPRPAGYALPLPAQKTFRMPFTEPVVCTGAKTTEMEPTYNRARVRTDGRLTAETFYGFGVEVINAPIYIRSQLNDWRVWTYTKSLAGIDGAYETLRVNQQQAIGPDTSFGLYQAQVPPQNFGASIADLRPTLLGQRGTEITMLPLVVSQPMRLGVRILAPAGYQWDFEQYEFRYKAPAQQVPESLWVVGVDADLPISGVPARPIAEPLNRLTIDYMQSAWVPGLRYGFVARIRVPLLPPTGSANQFTIEFGYNEPFHAGRLEAGVFVPPLVRRLIDGAISYTTNIMNRDTELTFTLRTISPVPASGGIVIRGPPNFLFDTICYPKPYKGYLEFPEGTTCLFKPVAATGEATISIIASIRGIPPATYRFTLAARTPPQRVFVGDAGVWSFNSFSLISEEHILDMATTVAGFAVNERMLSASFIAPPKQDCLFANALEMENGRPLAYCYYEDWTFYDPHNPGAPGPRNDQPLQPTQLIIVMQLSMNSNGDSEIQVFAPEGYVMNPECDFESDPAYIFDRGNPGGRIRYYPGKFGYDYDMDRGPMAPYDWNSKYALWPETATVINPGCIGDGQVARVKIREGLQQDSKYVFRIKVLRNPPKTPEPNVFRLEYAGQSSELFEGLKIWAFTNITIVPTTSAASLRGRPTMNLLEINIKPMNHIPEGGHLRIEAPSGFVIPSACDLNLTVHPEYFPNLTAVTDAARRAEMRRYLVFSAANNDYICEGDQTASNRVRLKFPSKLSGGVEFGNSLNASFLYVIHLVVQNPLTVAPEPESWTFTSFRTYFVDYPIDTVVAEGFTINAAVESFMVLRPASLNALVRQNLEINMTFPTTVQLGHTVQIVAPIDFSFNLLGDNRCDFVPLEGPLLVTQPTCGANMVLFELVLESIPADSAVRFYVKVRNPPATPQDNLFQLRHNEADGVRISSRKVHGFPIVPQLESPMVKVVAPVENPCRLLANSITGEPCHAIGSMGSVELHLIPTQKASLIEVKARVGEVIFDFSSATLPPGIPTIARTATAILASVPVFAGDEMMLRVDRVKNPEVMGTSLWTITTFEGEAVEENRKNEIVNSPFFPVLGFIALPMAEVTPIYYKYLGAKITFEIKPSYRIDAMDVLRITRPPGYFLLDGSLATFGDYPVVEQGKDVERLWNASNAGDPDYYFVTLGKALEAEVSLRVTLQANMPPILQQVTHWFFDTFRVLPQIDTDGEILDTSNVPYPWTLRGLVHTGTNDGAFDGFLLVGEIPFVVRPSLTTPGALVELELVFDLPTPIQAQDEIVLELTGPLGFIVSDNCLGPNPQLFKKCTGFRNTARLTVVARNLGGKGIDVRVWVTNPGATPITNRWYLALYLDGSTQYINWSEDYGYDIASMPAEFKGNNQFGDVGSIGFFTFSPINPAPGYEVFLRFVPPEVSSNGGYHLNCEGVRPLSFLSYATCESFGVNNPLELKLLNASLQKDESFTIGIGVDNPSSQPNENLNYWGLLLMDSMKRVFDGNLRIPALDLKSIPIRCGLLGWTSPAPRVLVTVAIQLRMLHDIGAGFIKTIEIVAPDGIMFNEDPSSVNIVPYPLPLAVATPSEVNGRGLELNLDESRNVPPGSYEIRFEVSNPSAYPRDNTWSVLIKRNLDIEFSNVLAGYGFVQGQDSPYEVILRTGFGQSASDPRRVRSMCLWWIPSTLLLLCAVYL